MSFGKFEQQNYQNQVESNDLSAEKVIAETSQALKDLQTQILDSTFFDNQEKKELSE
jgi:hypothetical protein